jgi:hypothetical protein
MIGVRFSRYVSIDHSGAQTPTASLKGLRVYTRVVTDAEPDRLAPLPRQRQQQQAAMPVVGYFSAGTTEGSLDRHWDGAVGVLAQSIFIRT